MNVLQRFQVDDYRKILTLHILELDIEPNGWGELLIRDGRYDQDPVITIIPIVNGSLPQSVSTTQQYMTIEFKWRRPSKCPILPECIKFTIMVDAGYSKFSFFKTFIT